ncbi:MAG: hypothetical protein N7Q72_01965, partial [Spiroplasma sp. Tabriz.8]|nr:hypothetical protein [Spiroplasma sp. Tabriz.8]
MFERVLIILIGEREREREREIYKTLVKKSKVNIYHLKKWSKLILLKRWRTFLTFPPIKLN